MGNATPAQAPQRAGLAQKGNGKGLHGRAMARDCMGTGWLSTAPEKLRLPRTCVGEAGQSRGEEVLYNALELNSNRFYKKKETTKNESTY